MLVDFCRLPELARHFNDLTRANSRKSFSVHLLLHMYVRFDGESAKTQLLTSTQQVPSTFVKPRLYFGVQQQYVEYS